MANSLIAFYSRADENYVNGTLKYLEIGNTEIAADIIKEFGVACVGVGSSLIKGTPQDIENKAKEFTNKMTKIRSKMLN